ncbi:Hypothetical protein PHPALM_12723 [Phytophthora palmivora]|uniref:Uncharacterized protein n=1 Tax=Phytophthora palmivora TaxID=4796 RepID=A0A2P4XZ64_9STRA|nr:Hypothetical protein PHPALM_12723 [Phytophthora palmivora]
MTVNDCDNSVIKIKYAWIAARLHHRDVFKASEEKSRCPMRLRLTASQPHQVHPFGYVQQLLVLQGIKTRFTFQITDHIGAVQEIRALPWASLAIEFDTWFSATANLPEFIKDVSEGRRVGTLLVFIDNGIKNDRPMLAIPINLAATPRLDSDESFVGFTATTSSSWQKHDILGWFYCTEVRGFLSLVWLVTDFQLKPPCLDQYDTEMSFDFDYNEQSMLSTASYENTNYPIFI